MLLCRVIHTLCTDFYGVLIFSSHSGLPKTCLVAGYNELNTIPKYRNTSFTQILSQSNTFIKGNNQTFTLTLKSERRKQKNIKNKKEAHEVKRVPLKMFSVSVWDRNFIVQHQWP